MSSQEPERYSVDEMLQRLKRTPEGAATDGATLVTRADGSQMMKVRRRKRRSQQKNAAKANPRLRALQVAAAMVVAGCLLLGGFGVLAYFNSSGFVKKTESTLSSLTGADTEIRQFALSPIGVRAVTANFEWPAESVLGEARFQHLAASVRPTGFVGGKWGGEEILALKGNLRLQAGSKPLAASAEDAEPIEFPYDFMRYRCSDLTATFGEKRGLAVVGTEASLYRLDRHEHQVRLSGGKLRAPGWGEFPIDRGHIEIQNRTIKISSLRAEDTVSGSGTLALSGTFAPHDTKASLDLILSDFPLSDLLDQNLSRLIEGRIESEAAVAFNPADYSSVEVTARFQAAPQEAIVLAGLPMFDRMKAEFQESWLARPSFKSVAEGVIERSASGTRIDSLRLERRNFLSVLGDLEVDAEGALSGHLDVGVSDRLLMMSPSPKVRAAFATSRDGYNWIRVSLSGSVSKPQDDFASQLAGAEPAPRPVSPAEALEREFEELIQ